MTRGQDKYSQSIFPQTHLNPNIIGQTLFARKTSQLTQIKQFES